MSYNLQDGTQRVLVVLPKETVTVLDRAMLEARAGGGEYLSRTAVLAEIITHADIPRVVARLAKVKK